MKSWSLQEANARFSKLLNVCEQDGPQLVTKSGTETAVLISVEEWLRWNVARPSLKRLLLAREDQVEQTFAVPSIDSRIFRLHARWMCGRSDHACEDALIAAMAEVHGLTLVTRNARDFARFDVPVFDPFAFAGHG